MMRKIINPGALSTKLDYVLGVGKLGSYDPGGENAKKIEKYIKRGWNEWTISNRLFKHLQRLTSRVCKWQIIFYAFWGVANEIGPCARKGKTTG